MALIDLKYATILLADRSAQNLLTIEIGDGTIEFTEKRTIEIVKRRGLIETAREGDEVEMDVSFQFVWDLLTANAPGDPPTVEDVLKHRGSAAAWVSTNPDALAPFCVDVIVSYVPPCPLEDGQRQVIILPRFQYQELAHAIKDAVIDCKGVCLATRAFNPLDAGTQPVLPSPVPTPPTNTPTPTPTPIVPTPVTGDPGVVAFTIPGSPGVVFGSHTDGTFDAGVPARKMAARSTAGFTLTGTSCWMNFYTPGYNIGGVYPFVWRVDGGPLQVYNAWNYNDFVQTTSGVNSGITGVYLFSALADAPHTVWIEFPGTDFAFLQGTMGGYAFLEARGASPAIAAPATASPTSWTIPAIPSGTGALPTPRGPNNTPLDPKQFDLSCWNQLSVTNAVGAINAQRFDGTVGPAHSALASDRRLFNLGPAPFPATVSLSPYDYGHLQDFTVCLPVEMNNTGNTCAGIWLYNDGDLGDPVHGDSVDGPPYTSTFFFKGMGGYAGIMIFRNGLTATGPGPEWTVLAAVPMTLANALYMRFRVSAEWSGQTCECSPDGDTWTVVASPGEAGVGVWGRPGFFALNPHGANGNIVVACTSFFPGRSPA